MGQSTGLDLTHLGIYVHMLHYVRENRVLAFFLSYIQIPCGAIFLKRNRSEKEVRAAALVLQTIWGYKELRKPLEKEGWKKSDFQVGLLLESEAFIFFLMFGFFFFSVTITLSVLLTLVSGCKEIIWFAPFPT